MATNEGLKPVSTDATVPIDPNVRIPDHVKAASTAADAIHQQFYPKDQEQAPAPAKDALPQPPAPEPVRQPDPPAPAPPAQQVAPEPVKPGDENVTAEEWRHRFLSMQGRYQASTRDKASMEEQMRQLGEELVRTQAMIQAPVQQHQQTPPTHENLITADDRANYGDELIDLARRSALSAVAPELAQLRDDNERLTKQVKSSSKRDLFTRLDSAVPNWRAINTDVRFKSWLRLPNIYTGNLRSQMLQAAVDGAEAPKVIALFKDFLAEAAATGQMAPAAQTEQQAPQTLAPRDPALALETLAAPGRARPASGDSQVPSEKPIYSRADIAKFYDDKRRRLYEGREAQAAAFEADLTAAQREGRIRG